MYCYSQRLSQAALFLAKESCRLVSTPKLAHLNTLAAAYAEAEQFGRAVEVARLAFETAEMLQRDLQLLQKRLDLYFSGKPYRSRAMVSKHCTNSGWINADVTKCNHCGGNSDA